MSPPVDHYQRPVDYLRVSVTDRCNLRCLYCTPPEGPLKLPHQEILSYEELLRLVRLALGMGISKVRITGGEPLVRKGVIDFCRWVSALSDLQSLSITTNGVLLEHYAEALYDAGVHRINISLDTLHRRKYEHITRCDVFDRVWRGITAAERAGFYPLKLNVVVMRGINEDDVDDLARLTIHRPYHVRFIEFMPMNGDDSWMSRCYVSADEILARLDALAPLQEVSPEHTNGPARHFRWSGAAGVIGLISPISHHFCPTCNRIRLTADGKLRNCLFSDQEVEIKEPLRRGASDTELSRLMAESIANKPEKHAIQPDLFRKCQSRPMVAIGG